MTEFLRPDEPVEIEGRNLRQKFRHSARGGRIYLADFEISKELWEAMQLIPDAAIIRGSLYWTAGDDTKGAHGKFWQEMFRRGALASLDLKHVLEVDGGDEEVKQALYQRFNVTSLTFVSPQSFIEWAEPLELHALAAMANQISGGR